MPTLTKERVKEIESQNPGWKYNWIKHDWEYTVRPSAGGDNELPIGIQQFEDETQVEIKCTCGTDSAYRDVVPSELHAQWCDKRRG